MIDDQARQFLEDLHRYGVAATGPHRTPDGTWCFHTHPSRHCYIHHQCRCTDCREIDYQYQKTSRSKYANKREPAINN